MKHLITLLLICLVSSEAISQNIGVGTTAPTNFFHISPPVGTIDPLKVELIRLYNNESNVLVINNDGVVKYMPINEVLLNIDSSTLDSIILNSFLGQTDTIFSNQTIRDSIQSIVSNQLDSLLFSYFDSLYVLISDSLLLDTSWTSQLGAIINTDDQGIDSLTLGGTILTTYIESGTPGNLDLLPLASDSSFYSAIRDSLLNDSLFLSKLDSTLLSDTGFVNGLIDSLLSNIYFKDSLFSYIRDSLITDSKFFDSLYSLLSDSLLADTGWVNMLGGIVDTDDQSIDSLTLGGTILTAYIESGTDGNVNLLPLASDSSFYSAIRDSLLNDSLFLSKLDSTFLSDTGFINGLIDSLLSNVYFKDSLFSYNRDSLINDSRFFDSLYSLLSDSLLADTGWLNMLGGIVNTDNQSFSFLSPSGTVERVTISGSNDFFELEEGTNISLTRAGDRITIAATGISPQDLSVGSGTANTSIIDISGSVNDVTLQEGTNIQLTESGNTITISATGDGTGTDDQKIDVFSLTGTILNLSLESDGQPTQTVNLSSIAGDVTGVTADNGLNVSSGSTGPVPNVRLGGALVTATTITQGANALTITNNGTASTTINLSSSGDFNVQDNGTTTFTVLDDGNSRFGGDVQFRNGSTTGTILGQMILDGADGRFILYDNGTASVDLRPSSSFVFNQNSVDVDFRVESNGNQNMLFVDGGTDRVGIGTGSPSSTLEVNGKTQTANFQMTSGATNGYVLQSDATGNASWANPASFPGAMNYTPALNGYTWYSNSASGAAGGGEGQYKCSGIATVTITDPDVPVTARLALISFRHGHLDERSSALKVYSMTNVIAGYLGQAGRDGDGRSFYSGGTLLVPITNKQFRMSHCVKDGIFTTWFYTVLGYVE